MPKAFILFLIFILIISVLAATGTSAVFLAGLSVFFIAILIFVVRAIARSYRIPPNTGKEGLIGKTAIAETELDPEGTVFIAGERWNARLDAGRIETGEEVIVIAVEGLKLMVARKR
jgi:membrane-bound serine protease (ClpP class)